MDGGAGFGDRLRFLRRSSALSQQELAERSGLSIRAISNLESGRTRWPYPNSVGRLADALALRDDERAEFTAAAQRRLAYEPGPARPREGHAYIPRLLPAPVPAFTGRVSELMTLSRILSDPNGTTLVTAVTGAAGVGKTALAVHWAHQAAGEFPDGQLSVDLRGTGPSAAPLTSLDAVRLLLCAQGIPARRLPDPAEAQLGLYRSVLAGKRMLIILDNARDSAQVRPLLPGSPTCRVIVTSRHQLPGLTAIEAARPLTVPTLTDAEARQLLARRLGPAAIDAHPAAVAQLISSCAGLPLALCIVAARAELRPDLSLTRIAADLAGQPLLEAFTGLADPAADIRASFSWSYQQLDPLAASTFRLAGLHPGTSIEPAAIAALARVTPTLARRALETLARASLIQTRGHDRYSMNTLLRAYALEQAIRHQEHANRAAATAPLTQPRFAGTATDTADDSASRLLAAPSQTMTAETEPKIPDAAKSTGVL
jgi:transcriptional regulator with XRE-family HTH domain